MSDNNDYAFPLIGTVNADNPDERFAVWNKGMTLRDYFAGQALMGFLASKNRPTTYHKDDAEYFYLLADAMLAERAKK